MKVEEIELSDELIENVQTSDEYSTTLDAVQEDYEEATVSEVRGYDSQDETVDNTLVFPFDGVEDCSFGSMAFGIEDGEVTKASATLHFEHESDEDQSRIRDYRYLHDDEEFYRPKEEMIVENEYRFDETIEVIEYYQNNPE